MLDWILLIFLVIGALAIVGGTLYAVVLGIRLIIEGIRKKD